MTTYEDLALSLSSREGEPHPRRTVKAMWQRLRETYQGSSVATHFLDEMRAGPPVPIVYPDVAVLKKLNCLGYQRNSRVYVPAQARADTLLHEFRHVQQRRKLGPNSFDWQTSSSCPREWYLAHTLFETDALTFNCMTQNTTTSSLSAIFNYHIAFAENGVHKRLFTFFNLTAGDLAGHPPRPQNDEFAQAYETLAKVCILPNGQNYLFHGKDKQDRLAFTQKVLRRILPPFMPQTSKRKFFDFFNLGAKQ